MISVDVCQSKSVRRNVAPEQIRAEVASSHQFVWVDIASPTENDWQILESQFDFHPLAIEDARKQNQRAKMDAYDGYLFLSARTWTGTKTVTDDLPEATDEIDIFLGATYLVTIHNQESSPVTEVRQRWEQHPERIYPSPTFLLYILLDTIVDSYFPVMDALDEETDKLEHLIYTPGATFDPAPVLALKKQMLMLRQIIAPTRDLLNELIRADQPLIGKKTRLYFQDVYDHTLRLVEQIDLHREILSSALDAMSTQTSNRLNHVMKTMTGVSTILMSAALVTGIYGMNFENMPELKTRYGYYGALAAMGGISAVLIWFFRRIKWF